MSNTIMTLRNNLNMTQTEFSNLLNIQVKSIRNWEQGIRVPSNYVLEFITNTALTLINEKLLINNNEELVLSFSTIKEKVNEVSLNYNK